MCPACRTTVALAAASAGSAGLDLVPKGRDEDALAHTMAWVRHHDTYGRVGAS